MKRFIWLVSGIALVMTLGCKERKAEEVQGEEYGKGVDETQVQQPEQDLTAERNQYLQSIEQRIDALDRKLQELEGTASERAVDLRQELTQKRQALTRRLQEAKQASADNWEQAKQNVDQALDQVQKVYDQAAAKLTGKAGQETPPNQQE